MTPDDLKKELCSLFCREAYVGEVPAGVAFSLPIEDVLGDRVGGYIIRDRGAPYLADSGSFLPELEASGIDVMGGTRREYLDRVLKPAGAYVDDETLEIRTHPYAEDPTAADIVRFLAALSTAQSLSFWTKETVRSTFADDAERVFTEVFKGRGTIERNSAPDPRLPQFTADMVLRPKAQGRSVAVFLVQEVAKLSEALLVWQTLQSESDDPLPVAALIEETNTVALTSPKVQRAVNRLDETTWFRHDEAGAARQILKLVDFSPTLHPS